MKWTLQISRNFKNLVELGGINLNRILNWCFRPESNTVQYLKNVKNVFSLIVYIIKFWNICIRKIVVRFRIRACVPCISVECFRVFVGYFRRVLPSIDIRGIRALFPSSASSVSEYWYTWIQNPKLNHPKGIVDWWGQHKWVTTGYTKTILLLIYILHSFLAENSLILPKSVFSGTFFVTLE